MSELDPAASRRIRREVQVSNYADGEAAMRDVSRIALFASVQGAAEEYLVARRATIAELNRRRTAAPPAPSRSSGKQATRLHDVLLPVAFVLAIISAGSTLPVPRSNGDTILQIVGGSLVSGIATVLVLGLLVWLEPYRTSTYWWPRRAWPAAMTLFFAIYWIVAGVSILWRWEPNPYDAAQVYFGAALIAGSGLGALMLWRTAKRNDLAATQTWQGLESDILEPGDLPEYYQKMDEWWRRVDTWTSPEEREQIVLARREVLAQLRASGIISEKQAQAGDRGWGVLPILEVRRVAIVS
ncbi:hypothetical protein ASE14_07590 [Agromyces sp. Root81]|uniref:hypothetical protein n=1 Tax=Agromyces sp. Root81 TaxID=1736601 RepID=UPI0006F87EAD|nr:hypothetical protein [Agromyces sp. Root81]KRC60825.1 hypothetical protein ASE14_07590 [Agromyces sp. Root81]